LIALSLPLAWLGTKFYGWKGIFMGITLANFLIGGIAYILLYQFLRQLDKTTKVDSTSSIKAT
ncbi:hypothetical protein CMK16_10250, partial [Candidatus Poribacteria bacterium]|nr:hypothetical protein [Candidatus Poribacteria bacterium]